MQSWSNSGQSGGEDGQDAWHSGFAYTTGQQSNQFDPNQPWSSQPMQDQDGAAGYPHLNPQAGSTSAFFDSPQQGAAGGDAFLSGGHIRGSTTPGEGGFQSGHPAMPLNQQFTQHAGQDMLDPSFANVHADPYRQPGGSELGFGGDGMHGMSQSSSNRPHAQSQAFAQQEFSFAPQPDTRFDPSQASQFSQPHLMSQPVRQQSHTPVQQQQQQPPPPRHQQRQYGGPPATYPQQQQQQELAHPPQQCPVQNQEQQYAPTQRIPAQVNGQQSQYQSPPHLGYQQMQQAQPSQQQQRQPTPQQQPQQPQHRPYHEQQQQHQHQHPSQQPYLQASFAPQQSPVVHPQQATPSPRPLQSIPHQQPQQVLQQQQQLPSLQPTTGNGSPAYFAPGQQHSQQAQASLQQPQPGDLHNPIAHAQVEAVEPSAKKRKRVTKSATDPPIVDAVAPPRVDSPLDTLAKKIEDVDSLSAPEPSAEEARSLTQMSKRSKASQNKQPAIKGLPHLLYDGSIKLPAPKSYDKLAPLVAPPSRSGNAMVPELGYDLPCEVQGTFTSQYRPSTDKGGLDERRDEAKALLHNYDRSMQVLGKRRPKYTEYPHAFKEQLKSDEATKTKAEKKMKKEQEDGRSKPIRTLTRPADPVQAAEWDAVGFVHIDKSVERTSSLIAGRVSQAGDLLIQLRSDMNRSKLELDQGTKDQYPEAEIQSLKQEAEVKKEAFYKALDATIEHADDTVLDNLGGHQKLVLSLVNALISCIKTSDFSGKIPKAVLELFTHFKMTKKIAEATNFDTVRKRFADKGDSEVKDLVAEITKKVKRVTKTAEPDTATGYTGTSAASRAKTSTSGKSTGEGSSAKRTREEDSDSRTVKKIAIESGTGSLSKKLAQPKGSTQSASKVTTAKPSISSILPGKARTAPKTVSSKAAETLGADSPSSSNDERLKSDVKKPATTTDAPKAESKAPAPRATPTASSSALSGIASLLDSINAPKVEAAAAPLKDSSGSETPETPEEKAKRLRKEARRKLRVSWKPEAELVQVKVFQKDEGEDEGREVNMIRDAADDRSEGMVLKQRANVNEDEDDDDIPYQPWVGPTATDFSGLAEDARKKNFVTRGGSVAFSTDEQHRIAEREQRELMTLYTDPSEIPPSPKSPPPETSNPPEHLKSGQFPESHAKYAELDSRWRDLRLMGPDGASLAAATRLGYKNSASGKIDTILGNIKNGMSTSQNQQQSTVASAAYPNGYNGHAVYYNVPLVVGKQAEEQALAWLVSERIKVWRDPQPTYGELSQAYQYSDPNLQELGLMVETVARTLASKPYPATAPPEWIVGDEERVREWWFGYNKEAAARQRKQEEERAKAEAVAAASGTVQGNTQDLSGYYGQQQQQEYAPYLALLQQMTGGQPQQQQQQASQPHAATAPVGQQSGMPDNQLQSLLAAVNQSSQSSTSQSQQPSAAGYMNLNPNDTSYQQLLLLSQMAQGQQGQAAPPPPPPPSASHASAERDWDRDYERDWESKDNQQHQGHWGGDQHREYRESGKEGRKKKTQLPRHTPINKALIGTKPCTFWQQGKCARGDQCTFRHD